MVQRDPNLPPEAQPWGRDVNLQLTQLQRDAALSGQASENNLKQLSASITNLNAQVNLLTSLKTVTSTLGGSTNTGTLTNDANWYYFGTPMVIDVDPYVTGKFQVSYGCAEVSISGASAIGAVAIGLDYVSRTTGLVTGPAYALGTFDARLWSGSATSLGGSVARTQVFDSLSRNWMYRITAQYAAWSPAIAAVRSINFLGGYLTGQSIT